MSEALIVGGGPAGAAAACEMARAGRRVVVLERDAEPSHKICGEFLGGVALRNLEALGVDVMALGARPIGRLRLVRRARTIEARLPFAGAGLSRRALDEALLGRAAALGAAIEPGARVNGMVRGDGTTEVATERGTLRARSVLLATGKHEMRGVRRLLARPPDDLVGLKMHFRLPTAQREALDGHVELVLFADAYAGLQMVEGGAANLCLLVDRARFAAEGGTWAGLFESLLRESSHLRARLGDATELFTKPIAIARVPYGFVHTAACDDHVFRLGDQMGVIPSFAGEGLAIALHTGRAAGRAMAEGTTPAAYHARMRRDVRRQIRLACTLYRFGKRGAGQAAILAAASAWPGALALLAAATRIGS